MTYFEYRQWLESMVPWWVPIVLPLAMLVAISLSILWDRWKKNGDAD